MKVAIDSLPTTVELSSATLLARASPILPSVVTELSTSALPISDVESTESVDGPIRFFSSAPL